MKKNTSS